MVLWLRPCEDSLVRGGEGWVSSEYIGLWTETGILVQNGLRNKRERKIKRFRENKGQAECGCNNRKKGGPRWLRRRTASVQTRSRRKEKRRRLRMESEGQLGKQTYRKTDDLLFRQYGNTRVGHDNSKDVHTERYPATRYSTLTSSFLRIFSMIAGDEWIMVVNGKNIHERPTGGGRIYMLTRQSKRFPVYKKEGNWREKIEG